MQSLLIFPLIFVLLPLYGVAKYLFIGVFLYFVALQVSRFGFSIPRDFWWFVIAAIYGLVIASASANGAVYRSALSWFLLLPFAIYLSRNTPYLRTFISFILLFAIFCCLDSVYQSFTGVDFFGIPTLGGAERITGPFSWESPVIGGFLMVIFFFPALLGYSTAKQHLFYLAFFAIIVMSGSRGAVLQILFVYLFFYLNFRKGLIIGIGMALLFILVAPNLSSLFDSGAVIRVFELADYERVIAAESSDLRRLDLWLNYLPEIIGSLWLFGAGLGGLEPILLELTLNTFIHPHHLYIELFLTLGVLGAIPFLIFLVDSYRKLNREARLVFWSFWGPFNMLHSTFDFYWAFMMFLSLGVVIGYKNLCASNDSAQQQENDSPSNWEAATS